MCRYLLQIYFATLTSGLFLFWHLRAWPFKVQKHNVTEAIGEGTLLLMYTTCLLLRNTDDNVWSNEWVSRAGYGWMLVGLFVIVCPSPMFYSLWLRSTGKDQGDPDGVYTTNPLGDGSSGDETLLEDLVRAAARAPERLTPIARLLEELQQTEEGRAVIPAGLLETWNAVAEALQGRAR